MTKEEYIARTRLDLAYKNPTEHPDGEFEFEIDGVKLKVYKCNLNHENPSINISDNECDGWIISGVFWDLDPLGWPSLVIAHRIIFSDPKDFIMDELVIK